MASLSSNSTLCVRLRKRIHIRQIFCKSSCFLDSVWNKIRFSRTIGLLTILVICISNAGYMATKRISERKIILYTANLVVLAGVVRFLHYPQDRYFLHRFSPVYSL